MTLANYLTVLCLSFLICSRMGQEQYLPCRFVKRIEQLFIHAYKQNGHYNFNSWPQCCMGEICCWGRKEESFILILQQGLVATEFIQIWRQQCVQLPPPSPLSPRPSSLAYPFFDFPLLFLSSFQNVFLFFFVLSVLQTIKKTRG